MTSGGQQLIIKPPEPTTKPRRLTKAEIDLWHKRIGHINYQSLYHMTSRNLVAGTSKIPLVKHICESCVIDKMQ
jgi:hypothetical protein